MKVIGRNDPCSCNSGKKFKKCCITQVNELNRSNRANYNHSAPQNNPIAQDPEWLRIRYAEGAIENILKEYTEKTIKEKDLKKACEEFLSSGSAPIDLDTYAPYFKSWLYYSWVIHEKATDDYLTIAEKCLEDWPERFSSYEADVLHTINHANYSFYLILDVEPGKSLLIKDIFEHQEIRVKEFAGTKTMKKGDILFCRPVTVEGQSIFVGLANCCIPNRFFTTITDYRDDLLKNLKQTSFSEYQLVSMEQNLRSAYFSIIEQAFKPSKFSNSEGEPIVLIEIFYDLKCSPQEVFEALLPLSSPQSLQIAEKAISEFNSEFASTDLDWLKPDSDIALGHFNITPTTLKVFVNSEERASKIKTEIANRLNNKVVFKNEKITPMSTPEDLEKSNFKTSKESINPEMLQMLENFITNHYKKWLDEKIPSLDNQTPREASKTASGREKLQALLLDLENNNNNLPKEEDYRKVDIDYLKRELGL